MTDHKYACVHAEGATIHAVAIHWTAQGLSRADMHVRVCRQQDLSQQCSAQLFDEEVNMAESIDFQIPMKTACRREISTFCKNVPHGHARVIRSADSRSAACQSQLQNRVSPSIPAGSMSQSAGYNQNKDH